MKKRYLSVLGQVSRLIAQTCRNPYSKNFGCCDYLYWYEKQRNHPDIHKQEACLVLALVYKNNFPNNVYFHNERIKKLCLASMYFWADNLHKDGSCDEFYHNERQLGATAMTAFCVEKTCNILEVNDKKINTALWKACKFLSKYDEKNLLSNHQAQKLMALHSSFMRTYFTPSIRKTYKKLMDNFCEEGYFPEYNGADLGYLTTTLAFLAEYYLKDSERWDEADKHEFLRKFKKCVEFISYFLYPDYTFAGQVGCRSTSHFWAYGFEIMRDLIPEAGFLADRYLEYLPHGKMLTPEKQDRYFAEQIFDHLQAYLIHKNDKLDFKLPFERKPFEKWFPQAGIFIKNTINKYIVINARKGGMVEVYDKLTKSLVYRNYGVVCRIGKKTLTNFWFDENYHITKEKDKIIISGRMHELKDNNMTPLKSVIFTGLNFLAVNYRVSEFLKNRLINKLIRPKSLNAKFMRTIDIKKITISDKIFSKKKVKKESYIKGKFSPIFVGYAKSHAI